MKNKTNEEIISDAYSALRDVLNRAGSQVNNGYAPTFLIQELVVELEKHGIKFVEAKNHFDADEVKSIVQNIYSEFAELPLHFHTTTELRKIIRQEVENRPIKPIKIFSTFTASAPAEKTEQ